MQKYSALDLPFQQNQDGLIPLKLCAIGTKVHYALWKQT